jgi:predicted site-specific integrase-resolvase
MKLSTWARLQGLSYKTAWRLWKAGKLPVPAEQLATGTVIIHAAPANEPPGVALYARVSSRDQKADLDRQLSRLAEFSAAHGFRVVEAARETGSGLNGRRKALLRIFRNPKVQVIVVEHRDRLMRFGFEYLEAALAAQGRRLVVLDGAEITDDIVRDLHEVIVSMCARLYGKRAAKNRAKKAIEAIQCESC